MYVFNQIGMHTVGMPAQEDRAQFLTPTSVKMLLDMEAAMGTTRATLTSTVRKHAVFALRMERGK